MKIHFPKFFQLLEGMLFIFLTLGFFKVIGLNMEINLSLYFRFWLAQFVLFCFLESIKNKKELLTLLKKTNFLVKEFYKKETLKNQKLIIDFLSSKFFGKYQKVNVFCAKILSPVILIALPFKNIYLKSLFLISIFLIFFQKCFALDIYPLNFEIRFYFLIAFWLLLIFCLKFKPEISLFNSVILLAVCPYFLIGDRDLVTGEKICLWAFVFLFIGAIHIFFLFITRPKEFKK